MFKFLNQCFARLRFWKSVSSKTAVAPSSRFHESPQNDRLNLSFVKDMYVDGKKLARNGRKTVIYELQI